MVKAPLPSTGAAPRLAALLLGHILPVCSLVAPCQTGASPFSGKFMAGDGRAFPIVAQALNVPSVMFAAGGKPWCTPGRRLLDRATTAESGLVFHPSAAGCRRPRGPRRRSERLKGGGRGGPAPGRLDRIVDLTLTRVVYYFLSSAPVWGPSSRELFYLTRTTGETVVTAVDLETDGAFTAGTPPTLFAGPYRLVIPTTPPTWDSSPTGERFLMLREQVTSPGVTAATTVLNWTQTLLASD